MPIEHHEYHPERRHYDHTHLPKEVKGFMEGGVAAVVAGVSTHPLDLIKTRMQLLGEGAAKANLSTVAASRLSTVAVSVGMQGATASATAAFPAAAAAHSAAAQARPGAVQVAAQIFRAQGVQGLFNGVSATALRQLMYSASRMGIYEMLKTRLEQQEEQRMLKSGQVVEGHVAVPVAKKVGAALLAGAIGASIGNPAELAMVRMQADGRLPLELRHNYKGVGDALVRIVREEGVLSLWRGCGPTIYRAMAVTAGQLAAYDQAKEFYHNHHLVSDGLAVHVLSAFTAAIVASLTSNPFDVIKTRLMNMQKDPVTGAGAYSGALDCALKTVKSEGPMALYKGLLPTICRQGPFALILFVTLEQVRAIMKHF